MIKRFVDFQSAKSLVELLTKIPNFKVNLTPQEKNVIGENGNVLVIGRSGTGKTTCAVLRLFSIEMLFKIRLSLYKRKFKEKL
jgi:Lhr-like helicase